MPNSTGILADPAFRRERASKAARARHDKPEAVQRRVSRLERQIRALVDTAPPLPTEAAERLAGILLAAREGYGDRT